MKPVIAWDRKHTQDVINVQRLEGDDGETLESGCNSKRKLWLCLESPEGEDKVPWVRLCGGIEGRSGNCTQARKLEGK